jgi:acetate kinase
VLRHGQISVDEVEDALDRHAGLLGLSGVSADLRDVLAAAGGGDERAHIAFGVYVHRLRASVAAMAAAMDGVDALVFTGGAGEGSARLRRDTCGGLGFLGIELDDERNDRVGVKADHVISPPAASAAVLVVHAREDLEVARQVRAVLSPAH